MNHAATDPAKKQEHQKRAIENLGQLHSRNVHHYNTGRQLFQHATALLEAADCLEPYAQLDESQKTALKIAKEELEFVVSDLATAQPHNYFVGRALSHLALIYHAIYDDKQKAYELLSTGDQQGHLICSLELARSYEIGSLTNNEPNLKLAAALLKKIVDTGDKKDPFYKSAQKDLLIIQRELGQEPSTQESKNFLKTFDAFAQIKQKEKYANWHTFFATWKEFSDVEKQQCLLVLGTKKLDQEHKYFKLQQAFLQSFPKLLLWSIDQQCEQLNQAYACWSNLDERDAKKLRIPLSAEERDEIYEDVSL